jgi:GntR family transcriptional regulator of arabinose operon
MTTERRREEPAPMRREHDAVTPLYHRIKEDLREAIRRREYTVGAPFITQRELCERYGVSTTTAIRALNDLVNEGILVRRRGRGTFVAERPEPATAGPLTTTTAMASRVASAAGPVPVTAATRPAPPRGQPGALVGCVVHGLEGPHGTSVVAGIESMCAELGYRMLLADSHGSPRREAQAIREAVAAGAAGIVAYPVQGRANTEAYAELRARDFPVVLVDRFLPELATDAVVPDHFAVGYELTNHLIECGHERIATLWSETDCTSVQDRLTGHKQSLREHGLPVLPELTVVRRYWSQADGTHPTLLSRLLEGPDAPTVLLCASGFVLAAAAHNLVQLGVEVPDQLELAGMDNAGPFGPLPLTTVAAVLPSRELGREAMRILAERISAVEPGPPRHTVLPITLSSRDSAAGYLRTVSKP